MQFSEYMTEVLALMADTDWSRHGDLADVSSGDLKAAATALWLGGERVPDANSMIGVLRRRYTYYPDDSAMASGEDDTRRFMDHADTFKLSNGLMTRLDREMANYVKQYYEDRKWTVIDLHRSLPEPVELKTDEYGTYVFTDSSV